MGKLVPFDPSPTREREPLPPPPADALERQSWLHDLLCRELYDVVTDPAIAADERRAQVAKLSAKITAATPHHEIAAARDEVRSDEADTQGKKLGGQVTRATGSGARSLRAPAPRRRKK